MIKTNQKIFLRGQSLSYLLAVGRRLQGSLQQPCTTYLGTYMFKKSPHHFFAEYKCIKTNNLKNHSNTTVSIKQSQT